MEVTLNNFSRRNYFVKTIKATIHCNAFSVNWLMPHPVYHSTDSMSNHSFTKNVPYSWQRPIHNRLHTDVVSGCEPFQCTSGSTDDTIPLSTNINSCNTALGTKIKAKNSQFCLSVTLYLFKLGSVPCSANKVIRTAAYCWDVFSV
jgi:hypothetical protein